MKIAWMLCVSFALTAGSLGCRPATGARVQADLRTFQREQTADKLFERGQAFAAVGDTTRAQEYLEASLEAGGDQNQILPLLLSVCVRDGRYRLAVDYAQRHLQRHPSDRQLRFVLGTLYLALAEPELAERELRLVAGSDQDDPNVHYAIGVLMRDFKSDRREASLHFREYLRLAPRGEHADEARASMLAELQ